MNNKTKNLKRKNKRILLWSLAAVVAMFFFGYALVPLYNVLCNTLGINGKTNAIQVKNKSLIDKSRVVTVQFLANTNASIPLIFRPTKRSIEIHPGQNTKITYYVKNLSDNTMTVQAVPSVTPGLAARHLKKTECFCFTQQTLKSHQGMVMPMIFHVDNKLPKNIHTITLSYTLFKATKKVKNKKRGRING